MANNDKKSPPEKGELQVYEKQKQAPADGAKMNISGHLTEIKSRLTWVIIAFVVSVIVCSIFVEPIVAELIKKGNGFNFVYISPGELVSSYVKIVMIASLVLTAPVILYQIWGFVRPALKTGEKRMGFLAMLGGTGFFIAGVLFAYYVAAPFTINFFINFDTSGLINAQISFEKYISFMLSLMVTFGLVFEMPMFLSQLGIVKPKFLISTRKYAVLVIFIVAAILTPPDVISQFTIAVPMLVLYEISIAVCRFIEKRKKTKNTAEEAAEPV